MKRRDARRLQRQKGATGFVAIFKDKKFRRQGLLNQAGAEAFEMARKRLAAMVGWKTASDGDVFIFLSIGEEATRNYLREHPLTTEPVSK